MAYANFDKGENANEEVKSYANNLILLSEFTEKPTTTLMMFWAGISRIIKSPV